MDNSIAVISFENQTGDKALDDYREIIPSRLITSLEQTRSFYVTPTERLRDILKQVGKGGTEFIDADLGFEVCRKDGVKSLVSGSYYRSGRHILYGCQSPGCEDEAPRPDGQSSGAGPESLFLGQVDELSRQIAAGLGTTKEKIQASLRPSDEFGTTSKEAYSLYLQGSEYLDNWDSL